MHSSTRDVCIASAVSAVSGLFFFSMLVYTGMLPFPPAVFLAILVAFLGYGGMHVAHTLSRWGGGIPEIARFLVVGGSSTVLEISILNILFHVTGVASGWYYSFFKASTFLLALLNSYFLNRGWTFRSESRSVAQFSKFFVVNIIGLTLNVSTASLIVNGVGPPTGVSEVAWGNTGAVIAVFVVMIWNFLNYKFFVFRSEPSSSAQ